jgi:hypothetical protein
MNARHEGGQPVADPVTTDAVWHAIDKGMFAVLSWVSGGGEPRSTGVVYATHDRELYVSTWQESWKARHISRNPNVAVTVTIPKRVPFMPFVKMPAAVASFHGEAKLHDLVEIDERITASLHKGPKLSDEMLRQTRIIRITPTGYFVTYGIGVPLMAMRDPEAASARVPV